MLRFFDDDFVIVVSEDVEAGPILLGDVLQDLLNRSALGRELVSFAECIDVAETGELPALALKLAAALLVKRFDGIEGIHGLVWVGKCAGL